MRLDDFEPPVRIEIGDGDVKGGVVMRGKAHIAAVGIGEVFEHLIPCLVRVCNRVELSLGVDGRMDGGCAEEQDGNERACSKLSEHDAHPFCQNFTSGTASAPSFALNWGFCVMPIDPARNIPGKVEIVTLY